MLRCFGREPVISFLGKLCKEYWFRMYWRAVMKDSQSVDDLKVFSLGFELVLGLGFGVGFRFWARFRILVG